MAMRDLILALCCVASLFVATGAAPTQGDVLRAGLPPAVLAKIGWKGPKFCKWKGVTCKGKDVWIVRLPALKIAAPLPAAWWALPKLEKIALEDNKFYGPLPPVWGKLKSIVEIYLQNNKITGTVPKAWANMNRKKQIGYLVFNNNKALGGCLPFPAKQVYFASFDNTKIKGFC